MSCVYITSASNKPSGGVKVMNQVAVLFQDHGFESYVVPADGSGQATFLDTPAPVMTLDVYKERLQPDDITIDFWPDRLLVEIATQKKNTRRIFWQHGASIPVGGTTVGDAVFRAGNPYTQHWNVSRACADYFQRTYSLSMPVVHPFFDSPTMFDYQQRDGEPRDGFLLLARRGQKYLPAIQKHLAGHRVTILKEPYHERDFFDALLHHTFFISTDDGIHEPTRMRKMKDVVRTLLSPKIRAQRKHINRWLVPEDHLLGFPMPPVEAAWLGCLTIGFAMGGGLEWMNEHNCFLARDADESSLLSHIDEALKTENEKRIALREQAKRESGIFTHDHTWEQMKRLLAL